MESLRARLNRSLDPLAWPGLGMSPVNRVILWLVTLGILSAIIESEPQIRAVAPPVFIFLNIFFAVVSLLEYVFRLWAVTENRDYAGVVGRIRYAFTVSSLADLAATLLLWIDLLVGFPGFYGILLRLARVLRVFSLTRNSRWSFAIRLLGRAIRQRSPELALSFGFAIIVLVVAATLLFAIEGPVQPDAFGSIPRAMWWAIATLTTVGYGDVYPLTALGKILAGLTALTAVAIVAMPTGIMAAAFSDAFQGLRNERSGTPGDDAASI